MKHQNEQTSDWDMEHQSEYTACAMCMFMYTLVRVWALVFVSACAYSLSYAGFINNLLCMHDGADPAGGEPIHYVVGGGANTTGRGGAGTAGCGLIHPVVGG